MPRWAHAVFLALAVISLSQAAILSRWAAAPPEIVGFWRMVCASICLLPFVFGRFGSPSKDVPEASSDSKRNRVAKSDQGRTILHWPSILLCMASGGFFFLHLWTYIFAAQNTNIAHTVIIFAANPLLIAGGAFLFFKERLSLRYAFAILFTGLGLVVLKSEQASVGAVSLADFSAFASAIFFAGYILTGRLARKSIRNVPYTFAVYATAAVLFFFTVLFRGISFIAWPAQAWIAIGIYVLLPTLLGHTLYSYLLKHMDINLMGCAKLLEPALAAISAWLLFAEGLSERSVLSFFITSIGIAALFWPGRLKSPPSQTE
ncbi:MAG: DMT family transporter [Spirochaetia bacterium]|nr:DMT family transporter [Spirochaetia bacterium]